MNNFFKKFIAIIIVITTFVISFSNFVFAKAEYSNPDYFKLIAIYSGYNNEIKESFSGNRRYYSAEMQHLPEQVTLYFKVCEAASVAENVAEFSIDNNKLKDSEFSKDDYNYKCDLIQLVHEKENKSYEIYKMTLFNLDELLNPKPHINKSTINLKITDIVANEQLDIDIDIRWYSTLPSAPTTPYFNYKLIEDKAVLTNVDTSMEYTRISEPDAWEDITENNMVFELPEEGYSYYIRYKDPQSQVKTIKLRNMLGDTGFIKYDIDLEKFEIVEDNKKQENPIEYKINDNNYDNYIKNELYISDEIDALEDGDTLTYSIRYAATDTIPRGKYIHKKTIYPRAEMPNVEECYFDADSKYLINTNRAWQRRLINILSNSSIVYRDWYDCDDNKTDLGGAANFCKIVEIRTKAVDGVSSASKSVYIMLSEDNADLYEPNNTVEEATPVDSVNGSGIITLSSEDTKDYFTYTTGERGAKISATLKTVYDNAYNLSIKTEEEILAEDSTVELMGGYNTVNKIENKILQPNTTYYICVDNDNMENKDVDNSICSILSWNITPYEYYSKLTEDVSINLIDEYEFTDFDLIKNTIYEKMECTELDTQVPIEEAKENIELYYTDDIGNEIELTADAIDSFTEGSKKIIVKYRGVPVKQGKCIINIHADSDFVQVAGGGYHTLALKDDGTVWAWGNNDYGQLGTGNNITSYIPQKVQGLEDIIQISTRGDHNLALCDDGTVWAWGLNNYAQLGDGTVIDSNKPVQITELNNIKEVSAGHMFSLAVDYLGEVYSWGSNKSGQLGIGSDYAFYKTPQKIAGLTNIQTISAGNTHALAMSYLDGVYSWGNNDYGQLGDGTTESSLSPVQLTDLTGLDGVVAGNNNSFFFSNQSLQVCGANVNGELGLGSRDVAYNVVYSSAYEDDYPFFWNITNISSNGTTAISDNSGNLYFAGLSCFGQFGDVWFNKFRYDTWQSLSVAEVGTELNVSSGGMHTVMLKDGDIYCSGRNQSGQCGTNSEEILYSFEQII